MFAYELKLVVSRNHPLVGKVHIEPADLLGEDLLTVPVTVERLDVYTRFLIPAACRPKSRLTVENIELMLQFVVAGRGVAVLPDWLVLEVASEMPVETLRIGKAGHSCLWVPTVALVAVDEQARTAAHEYWRQTGTLVDRWAFDRHWAAPSNTARPANTALRVSTR